MKAKLNGMLALFFALAVQVAFAQTKTVTGTVTDGSGVPLPGVNVLVQGTTTGTQTDFDGKYSMEADTGAILVFSYVGFGNQNVTVGSGSTYDVQLKAGESLDEVVVTALGITREKKSLGYATQEVSGDDLSETRNSNALNSISGKVAGVQVSNNSGNLGGSSRILIRGAGSISQENRPLIVVDGIPLDNTNYNTTAAQQGGGGRDYGDAGSDINPDDIATMNVLKGGAAAALYGSRASNGVILITTKSGKKGGKAEVTVNSGITFEQVNILPSVQKLYGGGAGVATTIEQSGFGETNINGTTYQVADFGTDESWGPKYAGQKVLQWDSFDPEFADDYLKPREWRYPDYDRNDFWNTGFSQNNGVAFSLGSEKSTMRLSLNNTQSKGIVPNSTLAKTSVNFSGTSQLSDKLKIDANVNLTITDAFNRPAFGYTGDGIVQQLYQYGQTQLDYQRLKKYKLADGTQRPWNRISAANGAPRYTDNPYWTLYENTEKDKRTRWYGAVGATYNFTDEFYAVGKIYGDTYDFRINTHRAVGSQDQPHYDEADRDFQELNYEVRLNYDKNFLDDKLSLNSFVGLNRRDTESHRLSAETSGGLVVPGLYTISNSVDPAQPTEFDSNKQVNSLYGSVSLGYDNFAYVTATGRNDWSSTLPAGNNSYFYPSISGSLVFSNLVDASWLSFGKVRGGYAEVGSDTDAYQLANTYSSDIPFLGSVPFDLTNTNQNANLGPEQKKTWEVGLEMAFLSNRISFDLTYYNEETSDLITPVQVDPGSGFTFTNTNAGKLQNKGFEALVNITPIELEDFSWDFTWNFAKNNSKLLELIEGVNTLNIGSFPFNAVTVNGVVGQRYGQIRGTNYVFDDQGNRVVNANGSYAETQNVENLGSVLPDYNMGFRNTFKYKNLSFGFLIDVQQGGKYRSLTNLWGMYSGILEASAANNIREKGIVLPGVTGTVTNNDDGTYTVTNTAPNTKVIPAQQYGTDFYFGNDAQNVFNADYVKLREVTLSYRIPSKWIADIADVTLSAFGRNLAVWGLDNTDFDPEVATSGSGNIQGSEGGSLPSTRSYGLNVQFKF